MKNVKAKKYLGQHFLNDERIALEITNLLNDKTLNVVEIGAGMGVLTKFLIKKKIIPEVVEIDSESVLYLKLHYPELANKITEADFLKLNLKTHYSYPFSLIGNFPYNISSQILFTVFENKDQIPEVIGMFQKEVAERVTCMKGKKRGILSVLLQAFYSVEYCFTVDEHVFTPPPKVKSGVIKLIRNNRKRLPCDEKKFKLVVKTSFNQRRKTLRNALKPLTLKNESNLQELLNLRAEQLSVTDFINLTNHVR